MMDINLFKLYDSVNSFESSFEFCLQNKLLPNKDNKDCTECKASKTVKLQKRSRNKNFPFRLVCRKEWSITNNTWFANTHLSISKSLRLVYFWLLNSTLEITSSECEVDITTACEYFTFCREVCYVVVTSDFKPIGGPGHIIEIDESHLYTRKYNKGRLLKNEKSSVWIFGGIDRDTKESFIVRVQQRNAETLIPLIKNFVLPGSKICSDGWKAYNSLTSEGYIHGVVNHSIEFINSEDKTVNTQTVERQWKSLKNSVKREGREGNEDDLYLFQFLYLQRQRHLGYRTPCKIFPNFLQDISRVYPGYGLKPLTPKIYGNVVPEQDD